jgi:hypothetical protein
MHAVPEQGRWLRMWTEAGQVQHQSPAVRGQSCEQRHDARGCCSLTITSLERRRASGRCSRVARHGYPVVARLASAASRRPSRQFTARRHARPIRRPWVAARRPSRARASARRADTVRFCRLVQPMGALHTMQTAAPLGFTLFPTRDCRFRWRLRGVSWWLRLHIESRTTEVRKQACLRTGRHSTSAPWQG